ncbi:hypothetical protein T265_10849 [Opisthorchis viverrini]|uniref:Uncharacterized protein n=1 Tax=Opisthorchis viverrini TaxID=6198 RepID=A0A074Z146_OPIVI|nr:hypothetical protein T265_10849 [Opisthorchis viverrini]KER20658.1 hypothetical protein T265_10849 [Opisthorchis viverrini]
MYIQRTAGQSQFLTLGATMQGQTGALRPRAARPRIKSNRATRRSGGEMVPSLQQECEGSKVLPPGDQHVHIYGGSDAAFPREKTGQKRSALKTIQSDRPDRRDRRRIIQSGAAQKAPIVRSRIGK